MTKAQLELMAIDAPVTVYPRSKDKDGKSKPRKDSVERAAEQWRKKYANGEKPTININDFI